MTLRPNKIIREFMRTIDLENGNEDDNSFNSSFDDNSVEEIEIVSKVKK